MEDLSHMLKIDELELIEDLVYEKKSVKILDQKLKSWGGYMTG